MSIATWKKEFFGSMEQAVKSDKAALEHGIRKWTGLLSANLKKHGIEKGCIDGYINAGGISFFTGNTSCALCKRYFNCDGCPIAPCWEWGNSGTPWVKWCDADNPRPMLSRLKKALKKLEALHG